MSGRSACRNLILRRTDSIDDGKRKSRYLRKVVGFKARHTDFRDRRVWQDHGERWSRLEIVTELLLRELVRAVLRGLMSPKVSYQLHAKLG